MSTVPNSTGTPEMRPCGLNIGSLEAKRLRIRQVGGLGVAWSMVWLAPVSRSSPGRSAVKRSSGTRDMEASTTAGSRLATAVPDEVITTAGALQRRRR